MTGLQLQQDGKVSFVETLASAIVKEKSRTELEKIVWDVVYGELLDKEWGDITDFAELYNLEYQNKP